MPNAVIIGTGAYLPEKKLLNNELASWTFTNRKGEEYSVTSNEIIAKTGIKERRIAENENTSDMAAKAGKEAISAANLHPDEIDLILVATSTPDQKIPKIAPQVATKIGMHGVAAYDFGKDCSGWIEAFEAASYYIMAGRYRHILVVGADKCSSFVNKSNKGTALVFGDGAGAVVVSATDEPSRGFLSAVAGSQGGSFEWLSINAGGSAIPFTPETDENDTYLHMDGQEVAGYARQVFTVGVERALAEQQLIPEDLDVLIPHQSNLRIMEAGSKALDLPLEKMVLTVETTGNTASASVPIAIDSALKSGKLQEGQLICFVAYGAGLSWISALMRW